MHEFEEWDLKINANKTEYLGVGAQEEEELDLQINKIKECEEYKYLGKIFSMNSGHSDN